MRLSSKIVILSYEKPVVSTAFKTDTFGVENYHVACVLPWFAANRPPIFVCFEEMILQVPSQKVWFIPPYFKWGPHCGWLFVGRLVSPSHRKAWICHTPKASIIINLYCWSCCFSSHSRCLMSHRVPLLNLHPGLHPSRNSRLGIAGSRQWTAAKSAPLCVRRTSPLQTPGGWGSNLGAASSPFTRSQPKHHETILSFWTLASSFVDQHARLIEKLVGEIIERDRCLKSAPTGTYWTFQWEVFGALSKNPPWLLYILICWGQGIGVWQGCEERHVAIAVALCGLQAVGLFIGTQVWP